MIAYVEAAQHPQWLAFAQRWNPAPPPPPPPALIWFTVDGAITAWASLFGNSSSNPALSWEYWNGTGWWLLPVEDGTSRLRNSGDVKFTVPDDLKAVDWAGKTNHWVRARLIGGDYGREKVVVKTIPTVPPDPPGTQQIVERTTEGIQPPYALNVRVAYAIDQAVIPTFLLTKDSGTLRDQSDANRTPGAQIEVFTPLIYALTRFETSGKEAAKSGDAEDCLPDCECPGGNGEHLFKDGRIANEEDGVVGRRSGDQEDRRRGL